MDNSAHINNMVKILLYVLLVTFFCFSNDKQYTELVPVLFREIILFVILVVKRTRILCCYPSCQENQDIVLNPEFHTFFVTKKLLTYCQHSYLCLD